jgi:16S rRNA (uracil1498-N3)-methyltransferase
MPHHPPRFLVADFVAPGDLIQLEPAETKHARVRRLRSGEVVALFDGAGRSWLARVEKVGRAETSVRVTEALEPRAAESPLDLTLAAAVLKTDRFDWLVEKATELGVTRIRPVLTRYSLARPSAGRRQRWRQIALAAAKQCGRSMLPEVEPPAEWEEVVAAAGCRLLLNEDPGETSFAALAERSPRPDEVTLIVGPEGGFADAEIETARAAGCLTVGLGARVLRAETAAIAAVALCQHLWGDLGGDRACAAPASNRSMPPR